MSAISFLISCSWWLLLLFIAFHLSAFYLVDPQDLFQYVNQSSGTILILRLPWSTSSSTLSNDHLKLVPNTIRNWNILFLDWSASKNHKGYARSWLVILLNNNTDNDDYYSNFKLYLPLIFCPGSKGKQISFGFTSSDRNNYLQRNIPPWEIIY